MRTAIDFTKENTTRCLIKMTIPILISLVLNMVYSLVDSIWIGQMLGEKPMAALTSSTAIILLLTCIFLGLSNGMAVLLAQALGAKDQMKQEKVKTTSFVLFLIVMIMIVALCEIFMRPMLQLLRTPESTMTLAMRYLRVYMVGVIPAFFYQYFTSVLRCYGNTIFQAACIFACTVLNAILDPLFILLFGFSGVALATVLTQTLSCIVALVFLRKKQYFHLSKEHLDRNTAKNILNKSVPIVIQQSIPALSTMALTALVSTFSLSVIAAFGIIGKMETMLLYPVMALNLSLTAIVGRCAGAGNYKKVNEYVRKGLQYGGGFLLLLTILVVAFAKNLSYIFIDSQNVAKIVSMYFIITGLGYIIHALTTSFLAGLNGMGETTKSMILYIFYFLIVRVPLAFVLAKLANIGLNGIWIAILISHFVAVTTAYILYHHQIKSNLEKTI